MDTKNDQQGVSPKVALIVVVLGIVLGAGVGVIGLSVSFQTLGKLAHDHHLPGAFWLYPLGIDIGILALILADWMYMVQSRNGWILRLLAWALTGFTVWANAHGSPAGDTLGQGMHAVMPILWVVTVEAARRLLLDGQRAAAGRKSDSVPVARWVFSPIRTALLYRRMRMWDIRSYPVALAREDARLHGIDLVHQELGVWWRWKAPRLLRRKLTGGRLPDGVLETVSALVTTGRTAGWEGVVEAWVWGVLNPAPGGVSGAPAAPLPGGVVPPLPEAAQKALLDSSQKALPAGSQKGSRGGPRKGIKTSPGGALGRGAGNGPKPLNARTASVEQLRPRVAAIAAEYERENDGEKLSINRVVEEMKVGRPKAKLLIAAHYSDSATPAAALHVA